MITRTVGPAGVGCLLLAVTGCAREVPETVVSLAGYEPATVERMRVAGWSTDLERLDVPLESVSIAAAVPRGAFVPIDDPRYRPVAEVALDPAEPVVAIRASGGLRAWPLVRLLRRELVLDVVDGLPVAVTFCSLCSTARVWDRRVGSTVVELAVSGLLLDGNSLLYDRETESLWRQIDGRAVAGERCGTELAAVPSFVISFGELARTRPDATVMVPAEPGPSPPVRLLTARDVAAGDPPGWMSVSCPRPLEPVLAISGQEELLPVRGPRVEQRGSAVVFRDPGSAAPFREPDGSAGPPTGSAVVFDRDLDGRTLTFAAGDRGIYDRETRSRWDAAGGAFEGPLAGRQLVPRDHVLGFRFALRGARRP